MGRSPCCSKEGLNRGAWTVVEDQILSDYIKIHGEGRWRNLPKKAGLKRCGKSCRLRWLNYLRPDIKRGNISRDEEELIIRLHKLLGNRWSLIAGRLPGRTDNEIKNYWNTNLGKKVQHNQNSASTRKHSTLSNKKNKKKPGVGPFSPSQPKTGSHVVRTKAMRCSKDLIINPVLQPNKIEHLDTRKVAGPSMVGDLLINKRVESGSYTHEEHYPTEFTMDVNMGELCSSDLLHSDFSGLLDFNYSTDNSNDLLTSSDPSLRK